MLQDLGKGQLAPPISLKHMYICTTPSAAFGEKKALKYLEIENRTS